jgi:hypothetical protein
MLVQHKHLNAISPCGGRFAGYPANFRPAQKLRL